MPITNRVRNLDMQFGGDKFLFYDFLVGTQYEKNNNTYQVMNIEFDPQIRIKLVGDDEHSFQFPIDIWWANLRQDNRADLIRIFRNIQRGQIGGINLPIFQQNKRSSRKKSRRKLKSCKRGKKTY